LLWTLLIPITDSTIDTKPPDATLKTDSSTTNADAAKPLGPPPRPAQQAGADTPDYFAGQLGGSLSLEPNPFEQSFGGGAPETPGGTKLPSVAALTSPSSLLPGTGVTPFNWGGGSLRTGPLSPAMLSGPTNDYFGDTHHLRGGFPTPNESSLRTGLTPGGSGSMFPAPSPNSQALFAQLASGGATPSTIDFHRTAISAAAKRDQQNQVQAPQPITSQPEDLPHGVATAKSDSKPASGPFDPHDNDAANGLFLLAQGRNGATAPNQFVENAEAPVHAHPVAVPPQATSTSPQMPTVNGIGSSGERSNHAGSEGDSIVSDDSEVARPSTRGRGKKSNGAATTNGRRKADDPPAKAPATKKAKTSSIPSFDEMDDYSDDDIKAKNEDGTPKTKMTDEEKRKNFLERNR
jgi:ATF/CREB family transcription factor